MPIEYEAKVLDIDPAEVAEKLQRGWPGIHSRPLVDRRLQRRYVYDITPGDESTWMRLRDDGEQTTLTIKKIEHDGIDGTLEWEVEVGDFVLANDMLGMLGFTPRNYQENYRTSFMAGGVMFEIDEWPMIPPYLEIEGSSKEVVRAAAEKMGFDPDRLTGENTVKVYRRYGIDLLSIKDLNF